MPIKGGTTNNSGAINDSIRDPNVFYLDGPNASTLSLLINVHGFDGVVHVLRPDLNCASKGDENKTRP